VVTNCTASGMEVTATNTGGGAVYRGGFIGWFSSGTLDDGNRNESGISPAIGQDHRLNPPGPSDNINS
jgi:hypothetical protein